MKVYDPILCMMVEKKDVKTNDKAGEMWYLYVDGKSITAFESWGAPVKEAKEYMKKNNVKGVGVLKKIGRGGSFTITAKDEKIEMKDADASNIENEFENKLKSIGFNIQKKGKTMFGSIHYQIINNSKKFDKDDAKNIVKKLDSICDMYGRTTYSASLMPDGSITAGVDLRV